MCADSSRSGLNDGIVINNELKILLLVYWITKFKSLLHYDKYISLQGIAAFERIRKAVAKHTI